MSKKVANTLLLLGAGLKVADLITGGKIFGAGGILAPIDGVLPKFSIPVYGTSDLGFWLIAVGAAGRFL
jgi:hypothetical protein